MIRAAGSPVKLRSSYPARVEVGRRVRAARVMAGGLSLRSVASATGLSYAHLVAIENGREQGSALRG